MTDDERLTKALTNLIRMRARRDFWMRQFVRVVAVVRQYEASDEPRGYGEPYEAIARIVDEAGLR